MKGLLSIILMCLYPLSPALRMYELLRHALQQTLRTLSDERWIEWLMSNPDDPASFPRFEQWIANMEAGIDTLVYIRAREMLGLRTTTWAKPNIPLQRRKSRSFGDLWYRLEHCIFRFAELDRLAARRAVKLRRLFADNPFGACPLRHSASPRSSSLCDDPTNRFATGGGNHLDSHEALMVSSMAARRADMRPSNHEGARTGGWFTATATTTITTRGAGLRILVPP